MQQHTQIFKTLTGFSSKYLVVIHETMVLLMDWPMVFDSKMVE